MGVVIRAHVLRNKVLAVPDFGDAVTERVARQDRGLRLVLPEARRAQVLEMEKTSAGQENHPEDRSFHLNL